MVSEKRATPSRAELRCGYVWSIVSDSTLISMPTKGLAAAMNHSISFSCSSFDSTEGWNSLSIHFFAASVPPALDDAVLRGLAKQPDQRYSGCGEFRRALEAAVSGSEPAPPPVAAPQPAWPASTPAISAPAPLPAWGSAPATPTPAALAPYAPPVPAPAPSNPPIQVSYASFGARLGALIADQILVWILTLPALFLFYSADFDSDAGLGLSFLIGWLYYAGFESSAGRGTPGKRMLGLRVTDLEGRRISFGRATGRYFGKLLSAVILYIGFLMMLGDSQKQTLHDRMAGCLVLKQG